MDGKKQHDRPRSGISKNRAKSDMGMTRSLVLYENFNRIQDRKEKLREDNDIRNNYETRNPKRKNQKSEALIN